MFVHSCGGAHCLLLKQVLCIFWWVPAPQVGNVNRLAGFKGRWVQCRSSAGSGRTRFVLSAALLGSCDNRQGRGQGLPCAPLALSLGRTSIVQGCFAGWGGEVLGWISIGWEVPQHTDLFLSTRTYRQCGWVHLLASQAAGWSSLCAAAAVCDAQVPRAQ